MDILRIIFRLFAKDCNVYKIILFYTNFFLKNAFRKHNFEQQMPKMPLIAYSDMYFFNLHIRRIISSSLQLYFSVLIDAEALFYINDELDNIVNLLP